MRLLNSTTLELEEFFDNHIPKYAILSHRWLDDEVSLKDMQNATATRKAGYAKLKLCCDQAVKDGLHYAWVDTCCIDKTSSAELTEAINSMYRWYQNAAVCYVYLSDVQSSEVSCDSSFEESAWFTRGWTLQELIAPANVEFYNCTWHILGTKESLKDAISEITGIGVAILEGADPEGLSVAKRMSWASKRTTTRVEDIAYSLLGLFGVNMPMLYGEGERAFIRLQEEIMKHSDDQSLFAWKSTRNVYRGLLAKSPSDFGDCCNIVTSRSKWNRVPYSVTNMGLSIQLPMIAWAMETYLAALDCELEDIPNSRVGVFLKLLPENDQYARVLLDGADSRTFESSLAAQSTYRKIYVRQKVWDSPSIDRIYGFWLRKLPLLQFKVRTQSPVTEHPPCEVASWNQWKSNERILKIPTGSRGTAGELWYKPKGAHGYSLLKLGFDNNFNPVCQLGGVEWGLTGQYYFPSSASFADSGWMDLGEKHGVFTGDRLRGLNIEERRIRLSITEEVIEGRPMWVVDSTGFDGLYRPNESTVALPASADPAPTGLEAQNQINGGRLNSDVLRSGVKYDGVLCDGCNLVSAHTHHFFSSLFGRGPINQVIGYLWHTFQLSCLP
jgi:hypothetical protein